MVRVFAAIGAELLRCDVDPETGTVTELDRLMLPGRIQEGKRNSAGTLLYLTCADVDRNSPAYCLAAVDIEPGRPMTVRGEPVLQPARGVQLRLDADSSHLLVTHTTEPGITVYQLLPDGGIGGIVPTPSDLTTGVFAHDAAVSPVTGQAVVVARGHTGRTGSPAEPGSLHLMAYENGHVKNVHSLDLSESFPEAGFNPRNISFHPRLPLAYVSLEAQNLVIGLATEPDRLVHCPEVTQELLSEPEAARDRQLGGSLVVHPDGGSLYAVTRADGPIVDPQRWRTPEHLPVFEGGENTISVFRLDPSGVPTLLQRIDTGGISARSLELFPQENLLVAANSKPLLVGSSSGKPEVLPASIAVFRIGPSGSLTPVARQPFDVGREMLWWVG